MVGFQLVWVDREGNELLLSEEPRNYGWPRISPDGKQLAFVIFEKGGFNVWIYDLGRDSLRRLTGVPVTCTLVTSNGTAIRVPVLSVS